jgi:hypothetical protein
LSGPVLKRDTRRVISNAILHLHNELPLMVDLDFMPAGGDQLIRCSNVRTVDGKRPQFVHDRNGTFVFPLSMIRLIEVPAGAHVEAATPSPDVAVQLAGPRESAPAPAARSAAPADADSALVPLAQQPDPPMPDFDEEPDEDLLARIRSV